MRYMRKAVPFPFTGRIIHITPGEGRNDDVESVIYEGIMDMHMQNDEIGRSLQTSSYIVSIPLVKNADGNFAIPRKGDNVFVNRYGEEIRLVVDNAEPSQLGGVSIYSTREDW